MNKKFYQNRIGIFPIFWGSRRKESDMFFFPRQVDTQEKKKNKPPIFQLYLLCPLYRSFSVHSREDKSNHESIKAKKTVSDKKETKNNQIQGNRNESSVDYHVIGKGTHKRQIKGGNVEKRGKDKWSQEKKGVLDKKETNNKARIGFRFPTLAKNDRMGIKKKYGHRVKVFFGHARRSLKAFFSKPWKRGFRKQKFLFATRKGRLKRKLYRNIKISKQLFTVGKKRIITSRQLLRAKRVEYRKYKKRKRRPRKRRVFRIPPGGKVGLIALKGSYNNIILTLTDTDGNTKAWVSAGTAGFKNGQKSSHVAAETAIDRLVDKSVAIGYKFARVKMKGMGGGKLKAIRRLCKSRLKLIGISDHFLIPHNGCRRSRKPRN